MKAVIIEEFGDRSKLKLADVPAPEPGEGEVLVRIKAAGVNPVDCKIREGRLQGRLPHILPLILGWDMAGVVEAAGHSARRFKKGDEVYAYCRRPVVQKGTYAEWIAIPESYIAFRPRGLSFEEAATIPLAGLTAYQCLFETAGLTKGQTVLIVGASGGVGSFAVQFARDAGAVVFAVASAPNRDYLEDLGAREVLDYRGAEFQDDFRKLKAAGADVVYDCVGGEAYMKALDCVTSGGCLVSILERPDPALAQRKGIRIEYVFVEPNVTQLEHIRQRIEAGAVKPCLNSVFPLAEAAAAHARIETQHTRGKIALSIAS